MNENRNAQFPGQPPGNFGMMSSHPGYVQPGMTGFPMMQQQRMMGPQTPMMQQQMLMSNRGPMIQGNMFPMQMGMRPGVGPPSYNQALTDSYRQRGPTPSRGPTPARNRAPLSPESQRRALEQEKRARQFQEQQQRLKNFRGGSKVDADSLIESMFGKSEKPTPKNTPAPPTAKEATNAQQTDDGFGDFLGGPSTPAGQEGSNDNQNVNNLEATPTTNEQLSAPPTENIPPKEEKKDLMAMMFECSDLSAPNKAKTFHKPSLKELPPTHHHHHTFQQSRHAHQWKQEEDLTGLFIVQEPATVSAPPTSPPPTAQAPPTPVKFEVPAWCHEDDKVPHLYRQVLEAATVDGKISTDRLYPILVLSGLPKETLGQIWSLANQSTPGQLIKPELYLILALIAFAQNNITSLSPEMLRKCPQPPVPFLGQQATPPPQPASSSELPPQNNAAVVNSGISGTLPMIQGSQTPLTAGNSGTVGTLPTVTGIQTSMVTGSPSSPGSQPVSSQGVPGVGMPGFSGLEGSRAGKTEDDDFADFQEAPAFTSTAIATSQKKSNKLKKEPEYLYSVPKPEDLQIQMSPDMNHSNISNFFGSDDSSVSASPQRKIVTGKKGASTPNSMDEDFDDFKSADSKPSDSSQFTSSEQSENEDFKVLESYLDDFNRKKSEQEKQQESPLHRPLPKFTSPQSSQLPSNATLSAIPAARNLWSKPPTVKKEAAKPQSDLPRAHFGLSPPESSDSDFADFQGAPSEQPPAPSQPQGADLLKASQSDTCLIGDEDKYAALRAFEVSEDTSVTVAPSIFDNKATAESEEDSWADFQAVSTDAKVDELKQINDQSDVLQTNFTSNTQNDWSSFSSSANVTSKDDSDWSAFGNGTEVTNIPKDDWSSFSQGEVVSDQQKDDWSNFSQGEVTKDEAKDEWASFHSSTASNDTIKDTNEAPQLVEVKKQHLQTKDILGLFKVKENPVSVVSRDDFVEPEREKIPPAPTNIPSQKSKKLSSDSDMDDDHFRAPPPMDYVDEEDDAFGDFSRGYDLDEVVNKPAAQDEKKKNLYNFYGMDAPSSKSISQGLTNKAQTSVLDPTETDSSSVSGNVSGFPSNPAISEDSMSTSSLELPGLKGRIPVVKDMDSQSISSNEFGNFETHQKKTFNPESKSLDSLDLKKEEVESVENLEMPENEVKDENVPEQKENFSQFSEPVLPFVSKVSEPLPVLGDRYSCLMEDIPGSDKHVHEWQKCLESCYKVVKDANTVFNSISSSAVCNEVITSEQGSEFVKGVVEIYRVVCRINVSIESTGLTNEKLKQLLKDIDLAWNNLAAFLVGGNMMPEDKDLDCKNGILKSDDQVAQFRACGVCLLDVDATCKDFGSEEQCAKLTYGGRQYHAVCANLWVNLVDSMLPALRLPELL